ncbi:hypothetical protein CaCOL14_010701 [Colletotrichum acutatum]
MQRRQLLPRPLPMPLPVRSLLRLRLLRNYHSRRHNRHELPHPRNLRLRHLGIPLHLRLRLRPHLHSLTDAPVRQPFRLHQPPDQQRLRMRHQPLDRPEPRSKRPRRRHLGSIPHGNALL